ncbi:MAG: hypothetical protein Q4A13_09010 [Fretibacterium sp.]|nr:hypothetical protein [Fretibacterium sp.]
MRDRMLRVAALAAAFVLAVAGSAVAAQCQWVGGAPNGNKSWNYMPNWDSGVIPGTNPDDVVIFSSDGTVTIDSVGGNRSIAALHFKGNTTLELKDASDVLTAKKVVVDAGCNAVISLAFVDKFSIQDTNTLIELADGASLTLAGAGSIAGAGKLQLSGKGRLILHQHVTGVNDLKIVGGGTLEFDGGDLPDVVGTAGALLIDDGNIVVGTENPFAAGATTLTMTKGDLTLTERMREALATVSVLKGKMTVNGDISIGDEMVPNGTLTLGEGMLDLQGTMILKSLSAPATSTIKILAGKTLSVVKPDADQTIGAAVEGDLLFDLSGSAAARKVTLNGNVNGKLAFKGASAHTHALALADGVTVKELLLDGGAADKAKLTLGNSTIDTLSFKKMAPVYPEVDPQGDATVGMLKPENQATLNVTGAAGKSLTVKNGLAAGDWDFTVKDVALALENGSWLSHNATATLDGGILSLPCGNYAALTLKVLDDGTLKVPSVPSVAAPLLTVKKVDVAAAHTLKFARPTTWPTPLKAGDKVTLLKVDGTVQLNGTGRIVGDPADDAGAKVEEINNVNGLKELVLTVKTKVAPPTSADPLPPGGPEPIDPGPGVPKPGDKGKSGGGGCDAGLGVFALVLAAAFLPRRKA